MKTATVKLTAAIGIQGQMIRKGTVITIGEDAAKDLLRRGKAVMATEQDEPESEEAADDSGEPEQSALVAPASGEAVAAKTFTPKQKK